MTQQLEQPLGIAPAPDVTRSDIAAWLIAVVALVLVIELKLLSSLLAGLLVYKLVDVLTPWLRIKSMDRNTSRVLAVTLIAAAVISALVGIGLGLVALMRHSSVMEATLMSIPPCCAWHAAEQRRPPFPPTTLRSSTASDS